MKRCLDILLSVSCLILFMPLILLCYLSIKLSGGDAIYKQERIGLGGRPFYIYKFRSMVADAEEEGEQLLQLENDPRLTTIWTNCPNYGMSSKAICRLSAIALRGNTISTRLWNMTAATSNSTRSVQG